MARVGFIEPMECLAVGKLPTGSGWLFEIKLDGYRMIAVRNDKPELYSRLKNSNTRKFPQIAEALTSLPQGTVIDGELAALDNDGRPRFQPAAKLSIIRSPSGLFRIRHPGTQG